MVSALREKDEEGAKHHNDQQNGAPGPPRLFGKSGRRHCFLRCTDGTDTQELHDGKSCGAVDDVRFQTASTPSCASALRISTAKREWCPGGGVDPPTLRFSGGSATNSLADGFRMHGDKVMSPYSDGGLTIWAWHFERQADELDTPNFKPLVN